MRPRCALPLISQKSDGAGLAVLRGTCTLYLYFLGTPFTTTAKKSEKMGKYHQFHSSLFSSWEPKHD